MAVEIKEASELIAGYTLIERIGSGGYGEVWSVEAPGGLNKAMKIVYGRMDDARAERELKALNRVKQVRHPFLLSLERIEIVDGRLVIVSELADRSLKDRYDECLAAGEPGIPRDELIAYLKDTADGLDHLSDAHGLQHLDVKPENLLLTGNHVKVADFGLVKDLTDASISMMGGLTPTYAPPEVFDDRASVTSDQYSLAIVYQEMLTGVLPFPGRTAAQLAAQHLKSVPRLTPLPPSDRPVVARCLAKDPERRYRSCGEFVNELVRAGQRAPNGDRENDASEHASSRLATSVIEQARAPLPVDEQPRGLHERPVDLDLPPVERPKAAYEAAGLPDRILRRSTTRDLPPLDAHDGEASIPPVILIGVGGIGGRILMRLRRRLVGRFGGAQRMPAIQMLQIDTDASTLSELTLAGDEDSLTARETMLLRLRKAQAYRHYSATLLRWLSRRWLYNIPRSLTTEGIRPLGRLALIDHAEEFTARLGAMIDLVTDDKSAQETSYSLNVDVDATSPNVFVVGSTTGGTASGMMLDVGYAVRQSLTERGISAGGLHGVLIHFTTRTAADVTLPLANTHACLTEAYHYQQIGAGGVGEYEGVFAGGTDPKPPFEHTYFAHLGDDLDDDAVSQRVEQVVDYLFASTATPAAAVLQQARRTTDPPSDGDKTDSRLRSFGVTSLRLDISRDAREDIDVVCAHVLRQWSDDSLHGRDSTLNARSRSTVITAATAEVTESRTSKRCQQAQASFGISLERLTNQLRKALTSELGGELDTRIEELATACVAHPGAQSTTVLDSLETQQHVQAINAAFEPLSRDDRDNEDTATQFRRALAHGSENLAGTFDQLGGWIRRLVDEPDARLSAAREATEWFETALSTVREQAEQELDEASQQLARLRQTACQSLQQRTNGRVGWWRALRRARQRRRLTQFLRSYARRHLDLAILSSITRQLDRCMIQLEAIPLALEKMQRAIDGTMDQLPAPKPYSIADVVEKSPPPEEGNCIRSLREALSREFETTVRRTEECVDKSFVSTSGGLEAVLLGDTAQTDALLDALRAAATDALNVLCDSIDPIALLVTSDDNPEADAERWGSAIRGAQEMAVDRGALRQTILAAPESLESHRILSLTDRAGGPTPTIVKNPVREIVFCTETSNLSLAQTAADLIRNRPDVSDIAHRLRTRIDVEWAPLPAVEIED